MSFPDDAFRYREANQARFVAELIEFVRFPSISAQPQHSRDLRQCAKWIAQQLNQVGLDDVRIVSTRGHPIIVGTWSHAPNQLTLLIYGHYDVQPADPLSEWRSPPFQPAIRGQDLFGRGASDDKGQLFAHVKALECCIRGSGKLPVNVICLFEGEEEIGSPSLCQFLQEHPQVLDADAAVVSDTAMFSKDRPAITHALRGMLSLELKVSGPANDLHSGFFGGAIHNPLQAISELITAFHDRSGRVAIPGFYDRVRPLNAEERAYMAKFGRSDEEILEDAQTELGWGETGFSLYERITTRPCLTINGITGGYQGAGAKSVIPNHAVAKLSFRLVPDQNPFEIESLCRAFVARRKPETVTVHIQRQSSARAVILDVGNRVTKAAARACLAGFGAPPVLLRNGGTIPSVGMLSDARIPTVLMGFALPDDRLHAPNEKFHLPVFHKAVNTSICFLNELARRHPNVAWSLQENRQQALT
jgi:acetylornithine deacetylase/succinyl-diaminopimelate desuccinylase-like protein